MLPIAAAMATSTAPRMVVEQAALLADRSSIEEAMQQWRMR
jgi:hypothetical protein